MNEHGLLVLQEDRGRGGNEVERREVILPFILGKKERGGLILFIQSVKYCDSRTWFRQHCRVQAHDRNSTISYEYQSELPRRQGKPSLDHLLPIRHQLRRLLLILRVRQCSLAKPGSPLPDAVHCRHGDQSQARSTDCGADADFGSRRHLIPAL